MQILKKSFFISLTLGIFLTSSLVIGELFVRKFFPIYDPSNQIEFRHFDGVPLLSHRNSTIRHWKTTGDYDVEIYSNHLGLRNRKNLKNSKDTWIYIVGDSFSFGYGVSEEKRFSNLLETKHKIGEVINISIPTDLNGYEKLISYAKKNGAQIKKLILGFCMENDFKDYTKKKKENKKAYNFAFLKVFLKKEIALYNLLTHAVHGNSHLQKFATKLGFINEVYTFRTPPNEKIIKLSIKKIKNIFEKFNIKNGYVLLIPHKGIWMGEKKDKFKKIHYMTKNLLLNEGLKIIDLKDSFDQTLNPIENLFFKNDGHWNNEGHKIVADVISKNLINH